jgi:hypothetical protein
VKLLLELDESAAEALSTLERSTGMNLSRIFSHALSLMLWVVAQKEAERIVATVDESRRSYRVLDVTALDRTRSRAA